MTRVLLAGAVLAAAAFSSPAVACTIDTCPYLQPVCTAGIVNCGDLVPLSDLDCVDTAAGTACVRDLPPID